MIAQQLQTGLVRQTITSSSGLSDIPRLPIGVCRIRCFAPGFEQVVLDKVEQTVGSTRTLDFTLQVGGLGQQFTVLAVTSQLDETTATLGGRIEPKQLTSLPLNGRNRSTLTTLVPRPLIQAVVISAASDLPAAAWTTTTLHIAVSMPRTEAPGKMV